jgi:hypothetical protein
VDVKVKEDLLEHTFKLLSVSDAVSSGGSKWWRAYPSTKNAAKYEKLFCFPFPQELYEQEFLDTQEATQLLQTIQRD